MKRRSLHHRYGCAGRPKTLSPTTLYLGDNGRCFCGKLHCAGMTAHFSGRDLSGQKVMKLSAASIKTNWFKCEMCGGRGS